MTTRSAVIKGFLFASPLAVVFAVLIMLQCCARPAHAEFVLSMENDCPYQTDEAFSHGTRLAYTEPGSPWTYGLVQSMYTPRDKAYPYLQPMDRPYAGWLYASVQRNWTHSYSTDSCEIDLGTVGRYSGAEQTQAQAHEWLGCKVPRGWDNQVEVPVAINMLMKRTYEPNLTTWFDARPHVGFACGNVMDYICSGGTLYLGRRLPDHVATPGIDLKAPPQGRAAWLYLGVEGRAVLYNALIDGDDRLLIQHRQFVADLFYGAAVTVGDYRIRLGAVVKTPEFETDRTIHRLALLELTWLY